MRKNQEVNKVLLTEEAVKEVAQAGSTILLYEISGVLNNETRLGDM